MRQISASFMKYNEIEKSFLSFRDIISISAKDLSNILNKIAVQRQSRSIRLGSLRHTYKSTKIFFETPITSMTLRNQNIFLFIEKDMNFFEMSLEIRNSVKF